MGESCCWMRIVQQNNSPPLLSLLHKVANSDEGKLSNFLGNAEVYLEGGEKMLAFVSTDVVVRAKPVELIIGEYSDDTTGEESPPSSEFTT